MTTTADLIAETRNYLMTGHPDRLNVLTSGIDDSTDTLSLNYEGKGIGEGTTLVIDLEEMHVLSITGSGTPTVTVIRGMNGSTAVAHLADALVYANPQFSNFRIFKALNKGLDNLSAEGLFRILTTQLTSNSSVLGYNLGALPKFIDIWRVSHSLPDSTLDWPVLGRNRYVINHAPDTTDFASGKSLTLREAIRSGETLQIAYKAKFDNLAAITDDVLAVSGLHSEAHDLPPLHAAIRLLSGREIKRSFLNRQPEPRRQDEVPPGAANQAMQPMLKLYFDRVDREIGRLKRLYPMSM